MFGVMTILLAAIGIYGLVAYTVQQSTQEIGIRMAVGAGRGDVVWTFLRRGTVLAAIGAAIGLVAATALSGAIRSLLYGVSARDVVSFACGNRGGDGHCADGLAASRRGRRRRRIH